MLPHDCEYGIAKVQTPKANKRDKPENSGKLWLQPVCYSSHPKHSSYVHFLHGLHHLLGLFRPFVRLNGYCVADDRRSLSTTSTPRVHVPLEGASVDSKVDKAIGV